MYDPPHGLVGAAYATTFWVFVAIVFVGVVAMIVYTR